MQEKAGKERGADEYVVLFQKMQRGEIPPPPVAWLIGFDHLREVVPGRALIDFEAGPQYASPMGTMHGGILGDLSDAAVRSLLDRWATWHWFRTGLGIVGFVAALRALQRS